MVGIRIISQEFPQAVRLGPGSPGAAAPGNLTRRARRSLDQATKSLEVLLTRQNGGGGANDGGELVTIGLGPSLNLSAIINVQAISRLVQSTVDLIQCEGIGGALLVAGALAKSGVIDSSLLSGGPGDGAAIRDIIPNGTISFVSSGNRFEAEPVKLVASLQNLNLPPGDAIRINGTPYTTFAALISVHSKPDPPHHVSFHA
jgi:hypothetical protein